MLWKAAASALLLLLLLLGSSSVLEIQGFSITSPPVPPPPPSLLVPRRRRCVSSTSVLLLASSSSSSTRNSDEPTAVKERVSVIVGGGPVGLATALTLSNPPHSFRCIVIEKTTGATSVAKYDASKAYLYNINPRGLEWIAKFPSILDKLFARGSLSTGLAKFIAVPADPKIPIPSDGKVGIGRVDEAQEAAKRDPKNNLADCSIWIPRHLMVELLVQACQEQEEKRLKDDETLLSKDVCPIHLFFGKSLAAVEPHPLAETLPTTGCRPLLVKCTDGSTYEADLVVGADGIDSGVRNCLANTKSNPDSSSSVLSNSDSDKKNTWLQSRAKDFRVKRFRSPSAGIKIKCLQIVPNFKLPNITSLVETNSETIYTIRSKNTGQGRLSMGMLPVKDPNLVRPANACVRYNHPIWSITTGPAMKEYFEKSFPRINWKDLIVGGSDPKDQGNTEWERFAKAKGTTFPWPQYSPGSAIWPKKKQSANTEQQQQREAGVVLVGDACHAFPPDIGQGINSGLQDVVALDRALKGEAIIPKDNDKNNNKATAAKTMPSLAEALATYQKNRRPEHRALIRLARFGGPYQYNQSWPRDRIGKQLFTLNFVFRLIMNKITLGVFPPPCLFLAYQKPKTPGKRLPTFRQVMRRADGATLALQATLGFAVIRWAAKRFGPLFLLSQL